MDIMRQTKKKKPLTKAEKAKRQKAYEAARAEILAQRVGEDMIEKAAQNGFVVVDSPMTCGTSQPHFVRPDLIMEIKPQFQGNYGFDAAYLTIGQDTDISVWNSSEEVFSRLEKAKNFTDHDDIPF